MPINVARKSAIIHRLMNYPFFFVPRVTWEGTGIQVERKKGEKERGGGGGKTEERKKEKQARKLFPRGKRETVEIENIGLFASRVHTRLYAWNEKQMLRVDRLDLVTTDSSQKSRNQYIRERAMGIENRRAPVETGG